jgi:F420-non-reducing hydrogenase iron-sulfur subunit
MKKRMEVTAKILERLGLSSERFRVEYVSAAEGVKFAALINEMTAQLESLGKERIKVENDTLRPRLERMLSKKK